MTTTTSNPSVPLAIRLYRILLFAYPKSFRDHFGDEMLQLFRTECHAYARVGSWPHLICFWLATLADFGITLIEEWAANHHGPRHVLRALGISLVAGIIGGSLAGIGARLVMRAVANEIGMFPSFTLEGTLLVIIIGAVIGAPFGVIFRLLRSLLPGKGYLQGLAYGTLLFAIFLAPSLLFYREGEGALGNPWVNALLFAPLALLYGFVVQHLIARFEAREPRTMLESPRRSSAAMSQALWFIVFVGSLELAVLGIASLLSPHTGIPIGILRAAFEVGIPLHQYPEVNQWLTHAFALGYFGINSIIFWQRSYTSMARLTALILLFFGGTTFTTGANYYISLVHDTRLLQTFFHVAQVMSCSSFFGLLCVFPHGRLATQWARWLIALWIGWAIIWLLIPSLPETLIFIITIGFLSAGLIAQFQHFRAALPEARNPMRLPLVGFATAIAGFALVASLLIILPDFRPYNVSGLSMTSTFSLYLWPWLCVPLSIAYAMRRHHLWQQPLASALHNP